MHADVLGGYNRGVCVCYALAMPAERLTARVS